MTDIHLGFGTSRVHEKDGVLHYDMWPAFGTQISMPVSGAVSGYRVIRNTNEELVLSKGLYRYTFRYSPRQAGPDALRYSVRMFGIVPLGIHWGDISAEGKRALRVAFGCCSE